MVQQKETETITCKKCGYEFLVPTKDPCPKCGNKLKHYTIGVPPVSVKVSGSVTTETAQVNEKKIVHKLINAVIIIISILSIVIGFFCEDRWLGLFIAIIMSVLVWYLGKKYAEKWIVEKIIQRDNYN